MTTAASPVRTLKAQADKIATMLKAASRGDDPDGKMAAALQKENITFALVMDDKILKIEIPWEVVRATTVEGISYWIIGHMRGQADAQN